MMRVFLDANILFSAARSEGAVHQLLILLRERGDELWADAFVIEEARRNLDLKHPSGVARLETLLARVRVLAISSRPVVSPDLESLLPAKDQPVLAAAIRSGCQVLVTGDRTHFGPLYGRIVDGVMIHSPASLAEAVIRPGTT